MDLKLAGQRALITGSTSGIGLALAKKLLSEGASVYVNGRSEEGFERVRTELGGCGNVIFKRCDITDATAVDAMMTEILAEGPPEIVVNNVGWWEERPFAEITDAEWLKMFDVNFFGMVRVLRRAFPEMLKKGYGRILNVSSEVALKPSPGCIHYSAAKTAVLGLSRGLAEATRGTEVTVNSLIYGPCWTEGEERSIRAAAADTGESVEAFLSHFFRENEPTSIAGRYLTPEELADTALYYCSPLSRAVNGASVRIDGGIVRHI